MFVFSNLLQAAAFILDKVLWLYSIIVMIAVLIQWVNPDPFNPIVQLLRGMTQPVFEWIRRRLPFVMMGMLDLSPMVVFLGIWFLQMFLVRTLLDIALRVR